MLMRGESECRSAAMLAAGCLAVAWAHGQSPGRLTFEAASIKPNRSMEARQELDLQPGGRFTATNAPVSRLISGPYRVQEFQIVGLPGWASSDRFDIVARADGNPTDDQVLEMIKSLLVDRFKLVAHSEKREQTVFALMLARSDRQLGPGLRQAPPCTPSTATLTPAPNSGTPVPAGSGATSDRPCRAYTTSNGLISGQGNTIPRFAGVLQRFVGNTVIDKTSLGGTYDLKLEWTPEVRAAGRVDAAATGQAIFTALREQLGLKLESTRVPADVLVVDRIERPSVD
jgi:uncharacterized protein (TIGR03435 family)